MLKFPRGLAGEADVGGRFPPDKQFCIQRLVRWRTVDRALLNHEHHAARQHGLAVVPAHAAQDVDGKE